jgi:hypothetical protein
VAAVFDDLHTATGRHTRPTRFWLRKIGKDSKGAEVRDVCSECNNGELAVLDGYICQLFDVSFANVHE